ncbi:DUF397 domain-containing protein [Kitasatospora sp. MAP12-44]|uniref:DUF397 domain-containing protein n=1 Tax=unclassified Kitasatospora TaxID=2633591 RepID=UPI0024766B6D|nr:DUF397 domain-containing protein [Kitasatospora sp. MAP12-44]MDH6107952.1 hypothetical protein [Kitasatospora sp. MAP12-44]
MSENPQAEGTPVAKPKYTQEELAGLTWYGAPGDTEGPQVAFPEDGTGNVVMRHGADHSAPLLVYTPSEWEAFQAGAADGEFDEVEQQVPATSPATE